MVGKGKILISEPFLGDPNFERTVVLLCEDDQEGTVGFILNKPSDLTLDAVLEDCEGVNERIYIGGPVGQDSLHFIYKGEQLIENSTEIFNGVYWGGSFEQLNELINLKSVNARDFRFFIGYSGWGAGQLDSEMEHDAWIVSQATADFIFNTEPEHLWRKILKNMGGKYKMFSNYPIDPRLN